MRVRLENGRGRAVGMLEVGAITPTTLIVIIEWTSRGNHGFTKGQRRLRMSLPPDRVIPWGPVIRVKWKERVRLKRAGLILPYEPHEWERK